MAAALTSLWQTWAMSCTFAVAWAEGRELVFSVENILAVVSAGFGRGQKGAAR